MAIRKILTIPDPILRKKSLTVDKVDKEIKSLMDDMLNTMYEAPGIGLAAIQIGIPKRIVVMDLSKDTEKKNPVKFIETFFFQFINPKSVIVSVIMVSTYVDRGNDFLFYSFWVIGIAFLFAIISINFWTLVGKFLRRFATNEKFIKRFNYVMSLLLLACIATFYL